MGSILLDWFDWFDNRTHSGVPLTSIQFWLDFIRSEIN